MQSETALLLKVGRHRLREAIAHSSTLGRPLLGFIILSLLLVLKAVY